MHIDGEQISAHLDGDLDASESARVAAHVESCAACRGFASEIQDIRSLAAEPAAPIPDLWPAIAREVQRPRWTDWLRAPRVAWTVAAAMAVIALASWLRPEVDTYAPLRKGYLEQIALLAPEAETARDRLPEKSRREIVASLETVDRAIADCERAIAEAPADPFGQEALLALYDEKVRVLRASIDAVERGERP